MAYKLNCVVLFAVFLEAMVPQVLEDGNITYVLDDSKGKVINFIIWVIGSHPK
jgi:hypothetical protein